MAPRDKKCDKNIPSVSFPSDFVINANKNNIALKKKF